MFLRLQLAFNSSYDYTKSTQENYQIVGFCGKYDDIRATLDSSYHGNYKKEREKIQDLLVDDLLSQTSTLLFSASC